MTANSLRHFVFLLLFPFFACLSGPASAQELPADPPLEVMIGQMVMVGFRGTGPSSPGLDLLLEDIRLGRVGGVIYFDRDWQTKKPGRNIKSMEQVAALSALLQKNAAIPLLIAVDQEGGKVQRFRPRHGFLDTPTAAFMGRQATDRTRAIATDMGKALRRAGVTVNFAPVADVAVNSASPAIGALDRAFSGDPGQVGAHALAFAQGLAATGVASSYKHFPGHGSALADSHYGLTDITATWTETELLPYSPEFLPRDLPIMVMTGHLTHTDLDPDHPASLSRRITTDLLRDKIGWQGVVVTDDLEMDAVDNRYSLEQRIRLTIEAGTDILLFGNNICYHPEQARRVHAAVSRLVAEGTISPQRIAESWRRIRTLKSMLHPEITP